MTGMLLLLGSYLLGSVSFSYLIVRSVAGVDVRQVGSGNAGATNAGRAAGRWVGVVTLLLDIAKGVAPVLVAHRLGGTGALVGGAALAVVLGHVFPVFLGFRGGKGVATAAGALGAMAPLAMLPVVGAFVLVFALTRTVSLASVAAALAVPVAFPLLGGAALGDERTGVAAALGIAAVVFLRHLGNLQRWWHGTEPRLGGGESR